MTDETRHSPAETVSHAEREILDQIADSVREQISDGDGLWMTCSGCHESEDGHSIGYPFSKVFGCILGSGCVECGGIGAIWDTIDYQAMGEEADRRWRAPHYVPIVSDIGGGP